MLGLSLWEAAVQTAREEIPRSSEWQAHESVSDLNRILAETMNKARKYSV